jgi:hypothetical protein
MNRHVLTGILLLAVLTAHGRGGGAEQTALGAPPQGPAPSRDAAEKSVTVFPVEITPSEGRQPDLLERIGVVVGVFLEKAGVERNALRSLG